MFHEIKELRRMRADNINLADQVNPFQHLLKVTVDRTLSWQTMRKQTVLSTFYTEPKRNGL